LEHDNCWQEIQEHLHDEKEVQSACHTVKVLGIPLIAQLNR
jgi:hypothetical protein